MFWTKKLLRRLSKNRKLKNKENTTQERLKTYIIKKDIFRKYSKYKNKHLLNYTIKIQALIRGFIARQKFIKFLSAKKVLKFFIHSAIPKIKKNILIRKITKYQALFRGYIVRNNNIQIPMKVLKNYWRVLAEINIKKNNFSILLEDASLLIEELSEENGQLLRHIDKLKNEIFKGDEIKQLFECPISMEVPNINDVVFCTTDKRIYSKKALMHWKEENYGELFSPITRQKIYKQNILQIYGCG